MLIDIGNFCFIFVLENLLVFDREREISFIFVFVLLRKLNLDF